MSLTDTRPAAFTRDGLTFRPATLDDAGWTADLLTARLPDEPADPQDLRHWWASDDPRWTVERFVVEQASRPVGYALMHHAPWEEMPKRYARIGVTFLPGPEWRTLMTTAYDAMEGRAKADGALIFTGSAREDQGDITELLLARGYAEERRGKHWELDLVAQRAKLEAMAAGSRAKMRDQGVRIHTLDADGDPEKYRKAHELSEEAALDVPTTVPHVREPLEQFMKWLATPGIREDRLWIAREGDDIVGISLLRYPPVRGNVWTDWTATARAVRGRGIARALKLETVMQAIGLGVTRVRTGNDGQNDPILHLNEELGYQRIPGGVQYLRPAPAFGV